MLDPKRIVAAGMFAAFGAAVVGSVGGLAPRSEEAAAPPPLLPVAHAAPVEVEFVDTLRTGETLSELLTRSEMTAAEAEMLLGALREHRDPRQLRPGLQIAYRKSVVDGSVRGMDLRLDADRTLNVERRDGRWTEGVEEVPVRADTVVLAGRVESSLYDAIVGAAGVERVSVEEREEAVDLLADRIFAWQVDFHRDLQPGDRFRILFERLARPDGTARSSQVVGVRLSVGGREHEAFRFRAADGTDDFYDARGESLRRAFLRAPLDFRRISSAFSENRFHPVLKRGRPHHGIDYAASSGTPVRAVGDGVVVQAGRDGGYGNVVTLRHKRGYSSRYAHLRGFAKSIRSGARVRQGDVIGYVGSTGLSTGPHLHYEFRENGTPINPNIIRSITGDPVPAGQRARFRAEIGAQIAAMQRSGSPVLASSGRLPDRSARD